MNSSCGTGVCDVLRKENEPLRAENEEQSRIIGDLIELYESKKEKMEELHRRIATLKVQ